jgi:hypothetical protein
VFATGATEWDCAPPSLQELQRYRVSVSPWGDVVPSVCASVADQTKDCEFVYVVPSTVNVRPAGDVLMVMFTGKSVKLALSVTGAFIVTLDAFTGPVYDPAPVPVQPAKENPTVGEAEIGTTAAVSRQLLAGRTEPPAPAFIVRKNCRLNDAV